MEQIRLAAHRIGACVRIMEVCGTHTQVVARNGLRTLLPENVQLISGPGCPVCVTPQIDIQRIIQLARLPGVIICTFGDMMRVPGADSSLERERTTGADVRVVYSPEDGVAFAEKNPGNEVVFIGVGFETTAPAVAAALLEAGRRALANFSIYVSHKLIPPAMEAVLEGPFAIDGFLTPGHVTTIIGAKAYDGLARKHAVPCVATGFEPADVLEGIAMAIEKAAAKESGSFIQYRRAVTTEGNTKAREIMYQVFEVTDAAWRGLGTIPGSGLKLRPPWASFDASQRFSLPEPPVQEIPACGCGDVLRGVLEPEDCPLFSVQCTPVNPVGPCMVSSEGACAARYRYG